MRPLPDDMIAYAAQDTRYLLDLRDLMQADLKKIGITANIKVSSNEDNLTLVRDLLGRRAHRLGRAQHGGRGRRRREDALLREHGLDVG